MHALHHVSLFCLMAKNATRSLISVDECQLTSRLVKQNGLYHTVRAAGVRDSAVEREEPEGNHYGKHDRVGPVEWIFLDEKGKDSEGHQESQVEQRQCVPLKMKQGQSSYLMSGLQIV